MDNVVFPSAVPEGRPVRLSEATRRFAWDSLDAVYGKALCTSQSVALDGIPGIAEASARVKYDAAIREIAAKAPIRFAESELICGSAALLEASRHNVPATIGGVPVCQSVSHLTCAFDEVLRQGLDGYERRIDARMTTADDSGKAVLASMRGVIAAFRVWHGRYLAEIERRMPEDPAYWGALYGNLVSVPFQPPKTFRQGVQALWVSFAFLRLCGNWPGLGRVDQMLGGLLDADLASGAITEDEARELLAHLLIKGCEWITHTSNGSGDGQHYQNIVLAGVDADGVEVTNTVTRLLLECEEELPIADYPIAVRIGEHNPDWLVPLVARVMKHGSGVCAVYNEKLVIDSMIGFGYPLRVARMFANDGCWEVQIPGKTSFSYAPMDLLGPFQRDVLGLPDAPRHFDSIDEVFERLREVMAGILDEFHRNADHYCEEPGFVCSAVSLFVDDCIDNAREYRDRGARYTVLSPHFGGIPDVANSILALNKLVFEEKKLSCDEFLRVVADNWEGQEPLRRYVLNQYTFYGNDNPEADAVARRIVQDFIETSRKTERRNDVLRPPGISTFGRQIEWKDIRTASCHGHKRDEILAGNLTPTPGTDFGGATAVIRSHCGAGLDRLTCGTALDIKLDPTAAAGTAGERAIEALIRGFVSLHGFFMQIDVQSNEVLLDAQKHPKRYPSLAVRISGWSARFVTLDEQWQKMVIERTAGGSIA